eukprot:PLAT7004.5.p1 GENE.PLAT7004.5~~PLAT7004.5.p1  ORF type:complete len:773 (-),score=329.23 PLAT7004.5:2323-4368(-)
MADASGDAYIPLLSAAAASCANSALNDDAAQLLMEAGVGKLLCDLVTRHSSVSAIVMPAAMALANIARDEALATTLACDCGAVAALLIATAAEDAAFAVWMALSNIATAPAAAAACLAEETLLPSALAAQLYFTDAVFLLANLCNTEEGAVAVLLLGTVDEASRFVIAAAADGMAAGDGAEAVAARLQLLRNVSGHSSDTATLLVMQAELPAAVIALASTAAATGGAQLLRWALQLLSVLLSSAGSAEEDSIQLQLRVAVLLRQLLLQPALAAWEEAATAAVECVYVLTSLPPAALVLETAAAFPALVSQLQRSAVDAAVRGDGGEAESKAGDDDSRADSPTLSLPALRLLLSGITQLCQSSVACRVQFATAGVFPPLLAMLGGSVAAAAAGALAAIAATGAAASTLQSCEGAVDALLSAPDAIGLPALACIAQHADASALPSAVWRRASVLLADEDASAHAAAATAVLAGCAGDSEHAVVMAGEAVIPLLLTRAAMHAKDSWLALAQLARADERLAALADAQAASAALRLIAEQAERPLSAVAFNSAAYVLGRVAAAEKEKNEQLRSSAALATVAAAVSAALHCSSPAAPRLVFALHQLLSIGLSEEGWRAEEEKAAVHSALMAALHGEELEQLLWAARAARLIDLEGCDEELRALATAALASPAVSGATEVEEALAALL